MNYIDGLLNRLTMYRVALYGLTVLALYALVLSLFGVVGYSFVQLVESLAVILASSFFVQTVLVALFRAAPGIESFWITAFILFFTLAPVASVQDALFVALGCAVAMGSKFYIAIGKKHIFNPAAVALAVLSFAGTGLAAWWVASPGMLPVVAVVGFLVVRKIRRFDTFASFTIAAILAAAGHAVLLGSSPLTALSTLILSWPLLFLGTIMLTEPLTLPPSRGLRIVYGLIVGFLFATPLRLGAVFMTPHLALLLGNLYSYFVSSRQKLTLRFVRKEQLSPSVYEFIFEPSERPRFTAGQYLEWTVPHEKPDTRGNRRYFTIASAPTGADMRIGARIDMKAPSTLKRALMALEAGDTIAGGSLAGDFILPKNTKEKLVFVAGGVGITPFVSMLRTLMDTGEKRDIVLLYLAQTEQDFAYHPVLERAHEELGVAVAYLADTRLTEAMVTDLVPDFKERSFYLSGPDGMVRAYKALLQSMHVQRSRIHTDYFPGF